MLRPPTHRALSLAGLGASATGTGFELDFTHSALEAFKPDRIFLSGDSVHWRISTITIDDREQLDQDLPGDLFSAGSRGNACWIDTLRTGAKFHLSAVYHGDDGSNRFLGALLGVEVAQDHPPRAFSGPIRFRDMATGTPIAAVCDGPDRVLPGESAWFIARPQVALRVEGIVLDLACEEWAIDDLRVGGRGQFAAAGSIPGEVFAPGMVDAFLTLDPVHADGEFAIKATYRGSNPRGRFFGATCVCRSA